MLLSNSTIRVPRKTQGSNSTLRTHAMDCVHSCRQWPSTKSKIKQTVILKHFLKNFFCL